MAHGPIRALRFIHDAIRAEYALLDDAVSGYTTPGQASAIVEPVKMLTRLIRGHVHGEDAGYFPALEAKAGPITKPFSMDHDDEGARLDALDACVDRCAAGGTQADLIELKRSIAIEGAIIDQHMAKEERLLWPLTEELFTPPEQGAIVGAIIAVIPREEMPVLVPWIMQRQTDADALAYVAVLEKAMPPPAFTMIMGAVKARTTEACWANIAGARPELA